MLVESWAVYKTALFSTVGYHKVRAAFVPLTFREEFFKI